MGEGGNELNPGSESLAQGRSLVILLRLTLGRRAVLMWWVSRTVWGMVLRGAVEGNLYTGCCSLAVPGSPDCAKGLRHPWPGGCAIV